MPMYDLECKECGKEFESLSSVADKDMIQCECGGYGTTLITQHGFIFYEGFDETLQTYITGPAHRRDIMKAKGIEEVHKCEMHRLDKNVTKRKKRTINDAVDSLHKNGKFNPKWAKYS